MLCENCDREILDNPLQYLEKEPNLGKKSKDILLIILNWIKLMRY